MDGSEKRLTPAGGDGGQMDNNTHANSFNLTSSVSEPVLWWRLINEVEILHVVTGEALAEVWECIEAGRYSGARALVDEAWNTAVSP